MAEFDFDAYEAEQSTPALVASAQPESSSGGFDFEAYSADQSTQTGESSVIDEVANTTKEAGILDGPSENQTPEYKLAFDTKMKEIKAEKDKAVDEEVKLDADKALALRNVKYEESDLIENTMPSFITGKQYDTDSMMGYATKRKREMQENGTFVNDTQFTNTISTELETKGATTLDIQEFRQKSRGVQTGGSVMANAVIEAIPDFIDTIEDRVVDPFVSRAMQYKHATFGLANDVASISEKFGLIPEGTTDKAQYAINVSRAIEDAITKDYEETYGQAGVGTLMTAAELTQLVRYAPVVGGELSWTKMAFADGAYTYLKSKGEGYDGIQAGAHGIGSFVLTKGLGKVIDVAPAIWRDLRVLNTDLKNINTIEDLPRKHLKSVRELQKINGWDDAQTLEIINGFKDGTEAGKINALETVRLLAQNSYDKAGRDLFAESILYDSKAAATFLSESTERANNVLKAVDSQSTLGKILAQNKLVRHGQSSIDWRGVQVAADKAGINPNSTVMKRINKNADSYEDWDKAYHAMIVNKAGGVPNTTGETIAKTLYQLTEAAVGKQLAHAMGTTIMVPLTPAKALVRILKNIIPLSTQRTKITKMVSKSLREGTPINPIKLRQEFKKSNPNMTDVQLNKHIEKVLDLSQKSKREVIKESKAKAAKQEQEAKARYAEEETKWQKMSDEEANVVYRDEEARMKALAMEREQIAADETLAAEAKLKKIKDSDATQKMATQVEKEAKAKELAAAKVNFKAKQADIKTAKAAIVKAEKEADKASLDAAKVTYKAKQTDLRTAQAQVSKLEKEADEALLREVKDADATQQMVTRLQKEAEKSSLDAARVTYKAKQADLKAAEKALEQAEKELNKVQIATEKAKVTTAKEAVTTAKTKVLTKAKAQQPIKYSSESRLEVKGKIELSAKGSSETGQAASREARTLASNHSFGSEFTKAFNEAHKDGVAFSSYLIRNAYKLDVKQVKEYYLVNPSRLGNGKFGIPNSIRSKFDIPQRYVKVSTKVKATLEAEASKSVSKQEVEMQAETRLEYMKSKKINNPSRKKGDCK